MRSNYYRKYQALTKRELPLPVQFVLLGLALLIAFASSASAQNVTEINTPTTTTLWAGTQDFVQFGFAVTDLSCLRIDPARHGHQPVHRQASSAFVVWRFQQRLVPRGS